MRRYSIEQWEVAIIVGDKHCIQFSSELYSTTSHWSNKPCLRQSSTSCKCLLKIIETKFTSHHLKQTDANLIYKGLLKMVSFMMQGQGFNYNSVGQNDNSSVDSVGTTRRTQLDWQTGINPYQSFPLSFLSCLSTNETLPFKSVSGVKQVSVTNSHRRPETGF